MWRLKRPCAVGGDHLRLHQQDWNHALTVKAVEEIAQHKRLCREILLVGVFGDQAVGKQLSSNVATAIARLTQVEQLLECSEGIAGLSPATGGPFGVEPSCLLQRKLVRLDVERGESARG